MQDQINVLEGNNHFELSKYSQVRTKCFKNLYSFDFNKYKVNHSVEEVISLYCRMQAK